MSSTEQPTDGRALTALVLGIVGLVGALAIASIGAVVGALAVVFGIVARRHGGRQPKASVGIALGALAVVVGVVSTVLTATGNWPG